MKITCLIISVLLMSMSAATGIDDVEAFGDPNALRLPYKSPYTRKQVPAYLIYDYGLIPREFIQDVVMGCFDTRVKDWGTRESKAGKPEKVIGLAADENCKPLKLYRAWEPLGDDKNIICYETDESGKHRRQISGAYYYSPEVGTESGCPKPLVRFSTQTMSDSNEESYKYCEISFLQKINRAFVVLAKRPISLQADLLKELPKECAAVESQYKVPSFYVVTHDQSCYQMDKATKGSELKRRMTKSHQVESKSQSALFFNPKCYDSPDTSFTHYERSFGPESSAIVDFLFRSKGCYEVDDSTNGKYYSVKVRDFHCDSTKSASIDNSERSILGKNGNREEREKLIKSAKVIEE